MFFVTTNNGPSHSKDAVSGRLPRRSLHHMPLAQFIKEKMLKPPTLPPDT